MGHQIQANWNISGWAFSVLLLLTESIFCTQVFELRKPDPPPSSNPLDLEVRWLVPLPNHDDLDGRIVPTTILNISQQQSLMAFESEGSQGLKIFTKDMQLVASKDTDLLADDQLVGMVYSSLHQKIWSGAFSGDYKSAVIQVNPSVSISAGGVSVSSWMTSTFKDPGSSFFQLYAIALSDNQNYVYFPQAYRFPDQNGDPLLYDYIRIFKYSPLSGSMMLIDNPANFFAMGSPAKASILIDQYLVLCYYSGFSSGLSLYDVLTGEFLVGLTTHNPSVEKIETFVHDSADIKHTYLTTNEQPASGDPCNRRISDVNLFVLTGLNAYEYNTTSIQNHPSVDLGYEAQTLHGQNLLDFRLFRMIGVTSQFQASTGTFDGTKLYLTLISKATFTVIPADYVLGEPLALASYTVTQPMITPTGIYFGALMKAPLPMYKFQTFSLSHTLCGPFDGDLLVATPSTVEKDIWADIKSNCLDSRCSGKNCTLNTKSVDQLSRENMVGCVTFEFDLFVRNEPKEFSFSLYDLLKKETVPINSSLIITNWTATRLCFNFSNMSNTIDQRGIYEAVFSIKAKNSSERPVRSADLTRRFEAFPIDVKFSRTPTSIKDLFDSLKDTTGKTATIAQAVLLGSTLALMGANPGAAFVISQVISTFTLLSLLNGPRLVLPEAVFTSLMSVKLIDLGLQDGFDEYAEDPKEVPISDTADRLDVRSSIVKNAGEDLVLLTIVLACNLFITASSKLFLHLSKQPEGSWSRKVATFVGKSYGVPYFAAEVDSSAMELLTFVWANLFYASTGSGAAKLSVAVSAGLLALYLGLAWLDWKVARGLAPQLKDINNSQEGSLLEKASIQPSWLGSLAFLWEGHSSTVSHIALYSPLIGLCRAVLSTGAVLGLARAGVSQLIVFGVIELGYIFVMLKWRWKESLLDHVVSIIMEIWDLLYLVAKLVSWANMSDEYRQVTMGTILSWIILSKLVIAVTVCLITLIVELVCYVKKCQKQISRIKTSPLSLNTTQDNLSRQGATSNSLTSGSELKHYHNSAVGDDDRSKGYDQSIPAVVPTLFHPQEEHSLQPQIAKHQQSLRGSKAWLGARPRIIPIQNSAGGEWSF